MENNPKNEDNLKTEEDSKNEDNPQIEDDPKNKDAPIKKKPLSITANPKMKTNPIGRPPKNKDYPNMKTSQKSRRPKL